MTHIPLAQSLAPTGQKKHALQRCGHYQFVPADMIGKNLQKPPCQQCIAESLDEREENTRRAHHQVNSAIFIRPSKFSRFCEKVSKLVTFLANG